MPDDVLLINVPGPGDTDGVDVVGSLPAVPNLPDLAPVSARIDALEASDTDQSIRILALEFDSGTADPGAVQNLIDTSIDAHVADATPHPAYDDLPSLTLLFENGLI